VAKDTQLSTVAAMVTPLCWPAAWLAPTPTQKFFMKFPIIGLDRRLFRSFRRQLAMRSREALTLWGDDPGIIAIRDQISAIIARDFYWPNRNFIPDDPCSVVMFNPLPLADTPRVIKYIESQVGRSEAFSQLATLTYGEFIGKLNRDRQLSSTR